MRSPTRSHVSSAVRQQPVSFEPPKVLPRRAQHLSISATLLVLLLDTLLQQPNLQTLPARTCTSPAPSYTYLDPGNWSRHLRDEDFLLEQQCSTSCSMGATRRIKPRLKLQLSL